MFKSNYVRIEIVLRDAIQVRMQRFKSNYVRIEIKCVLRRLNCFALFKSNYVRIEILIDNYNSLLKLQFKSNYVRIEIRNLYFNWSFAVLRLNRTMLELKSGSSVNAVHEIAGFKSNYVRIEIQNPYANTTARKIV